jgi:hypothetical protein
MAISNEWCVAVFKCGPDMVKKVLVEVYRFVDALKGVRSLHFLIRDRVDDEVVFSFRVMVEPKFKEMVKTMSLTPAAGTSLEQYVAWQPEKRIADFGQIKWRSVF